MNKAVRRINSFPKNRFYKTLSKIRILLDKPESPIVQRDIIAILSKELVSLDKCVALFCSKFKANLLLYTMQSFPLSLQNCFQILNFLKDNILNFKIEECGE